MNLIYLNQYIRKYSVSCPEKEEICGPDYESKFSPKPFDD